MRKLIYTFAIISALFLITGCSDKVDSTENKEKTTTEQESSKNTNKEKTKATKIDEGANTIGDTIDLDGVKVTLNNARFEKGNSFNEPNKDQFLVVDATVDNTTNEQVVVSSIINLRLKDVDQQDYPTIVLRMDGIKNQLDGVVDAGEQLNGDASFDVTETAKYEFIYTNSSTGEEAVWQFTKEELK